MPLLSPAPRTCRLLMAVLLLAPLAVRAQPLEQKLTASDGSDADQFGTAVSVAGEVAVVGARWDDDNGLASGSAYVFRYDGDAWVEAQKLLASDGLSGEWFGESVSVSGETVVVGAPFNDWNGSAYAFRYDGDAWVEVQKLRASNGDDGDEFGCSVSVSGEVLAVGARRYYYSGSAYVFRYDGATWVEDQQFRVSPTQTRDRFGWSVSVSGDVLVAGAPFVEYPQFGVGFAYVFRYDGASWMEEQRLSPGGLSYGAEFGRSVAVEGDVAVVGAPQDGVRGAAFVFRYDGSTWVEEQRLTASDWSYGDEFGRAVSISGEVIVVGARLDDDHGPSSGSAYVFRYDGDAWVEAQKLMASDGSTGDLFGEAVAVADEVVLVGAPYDGDNGLGSGSAYAYGLPASVAVEPEAAPTPLVLHPPAPNPTADRAAVAIALTQPSAVRLALYDVLGREVAAEESGTLSQGSHRLGLDVSALPAGVYVWRLAAGERTEAGRLTVAR